MNPLKPSDKTPFTFFKTLFGDCLTSGRYSEIRGFNGSQCKQMFFQDLESFLAEASAQPSGWNYYFGVHPRDSKKGDREQVSAVTSIHADMDVKDHGSFEEIYKIIKAFQFPPTVVVKTGNGVHVYWFLKEVEEIEDKDRFERIQAGIQNHLGADKTHDLPRILRIPGTKNWRDSENPKECNIVFADYSRRYNISDFDQFRSFHVSGGESELTDLEEDEIHEGKRNATLTSLAGSFRRPGMVRNEIEAALQVANKNRCKPPLPDDEVRRIAKSVARYEPHLDVVHLSEKQQREPFSPPHWKLLDVRSVDNWNCPTLRLIIECLIVLGTLVLVAAQSQTGKSLLWIYIARMLVQGGCLFGKYQIHPVRRVLYLCLEDPDRRVQERLLDTDHEFDQRPEEGRLLVYVAPGLSITDESTFRYMESLIKEEQLDVLILDTYQRATPGISSFNDEEQSVILHRLAELTRKHEITIIVLDHVRKESGSGRKRSTLSLDDIKGTGGKAQNADTVILMERVDQQIRFQAFSKDFDQPVGILVDVAPKGSDSPKFSYAGELDELKTSSKDRGIRNKQRVLEAMPFDEWVSNHDIAAKTKLAPSTVNKHFSALSDEGKIDEAGEKRWRKYCRIAEGTEEENSDRSANV